LEIYSEEFKQYLLIILKKIQLNKNEINKENLPDLGNFFVLLFFSDFYSKLKNEIKSNLFEEFISRQFYWILHARNSAEKKETLIKEFLANDKNLAYNYYLDNLKPHMKIPKIEKILTDYCPPEIFSELKDTTKNKLLDYYFKNNQGNKLLMISYLAAEKIKDKILFEKLEKFSGVISEKDADEFLLEIKEKTDKTMSLFGLSKLISLDDYFESKRESFDKFIYCYYRAEEKKYVEMNIKNIKLKKDLYFKYSGNQKEEEEKQTDVVSEDGFSVIKNKEKKSVNNVDYNNNNYNYNQNYRNNYYYGGNNYNFYNKNYSGYGSTNRKINNHKGNNNYYAEDNFTIRIEKGDEEKFFN